ncbi:MAG TPA: hypothetical protein VJO16_11095 [Candidatus Acidoferrum sp.]|nr:hypothetical protein [Candidatus Acidoferrum sp.]
MKRLGELILYPILAIAALILFFYPAFMAPVAYRLFLIALGLAGILISCFVFHWWRHPGIYRTKSLARWLWHIALATLMLVLAPLLAVFELGHFTHFLAPVMKLHKLLGLDFRFEPGERVQARIDVPGSSPLQVMGSVISVRLVRPNDLATPRGAAGPILYLVQLDDGTRVEIAEQFLKEAL